MWEATRPTLNALRSYKGDHDPLRIQIDDLDVGDIKRNVFFGMKREDEPLKPEAIAVLSKRRNEQPPQVRCLPQGVPGVMMVYAFKIIQTPRELIMIGETPIRRGRFIWTVAAYRKILTLRGWDIR